MLEGVLVDLVPYGSRFTEQDHRWENNESVFWSGAGERNFVSKAQIEAEHKRRSESTQRRTGMSFGVLTKDGTPIGHFGYNWISAHNRFADLGASIGEPAYWGGGYGTDALLLLIDYSFRMLDLRKVWLSTTTLNARVLRQMEKVGFKQEGLLRQTALMDGVWADEPIYGMFCEEWPGYTVMVERLGLAAKAKTNADSV
ncbi:MAG: GNAT family N-acetyltransferase [Chloroflexi bacterium]|nr:GNAT family N-acetyltransferase [Chloroflexota bacterium]